MTTMTHSNERN